MKPYNSQQGGGGKDGEMGGKREEEKVRGKEAGRGERDEGREGEQAG